MVDAPIAWAVGPNAAVISAAVALLRSCRRPSLLLCSLSLRPFVLRFLRVDRSRGSSKNKYGRRTDHQFHRHMSHLFKYGIFRTLAPSANVGDINLDAAFRNA